MKASRTAVVVAALMLTAGVGAGTTFAAGSGTPRQADLKVSLFANGRCGTFADSLPTLVSREGIRPGDSVSDLTVCVTNAGRTDGAVGLSVIERSEYDVTCDGQEPTYDSTCGTGQVGELGPNLTQHIGVGSCTTSLQTSPALDRRLSQLDSAVALVPRVRPRQVICARLVLEYSPAGASDDVASQSDRTTWRYSFGIIEN